MRLLLALLLLLPQVVWAETNKVPPPAPMAEVPALVPEVAVPENDRLRDYENFITGLDEGAPVLPATPPATGAALPIAEPAKPAKRPIPGLKVYSFPREIKRGMSIESGVKVYRGATPADKAN
jgi:hypothetical protein